MARTPQEITDAELAILQDLWDHGPSTIRQLTDRLYPDGAVSSYATVQKLLERLQAKSFISRNRDESVHVFSPAINRDQIIHRKLQTVAEKLCGGSMTPLITHLVKTEKLSPSDLQELRDLINQLDNDQHKKTNRRKPNE